jgi:outer membrane protein assembly factor BamB
MMRALRLAMPVVAVVTLGVAACGGPVSKAPPSSPVLPPLADVPEYRASTARTGVYPGPGPIQEPLLVWSRTIDGPIAFNSILADGLILFGGSDSSFYALDARTGAERWRFTAAAGFNVYGSTADGTVVAVSDDGILHALDLATGRERWSRQGMAAGTSIVDGVVYAPGADDHAYGLDLATGKERWSWAAPADVVYLTVVDGVAYASVDDGRLYAISLAGGSERWHIQTLSSAPRVAEIDGDIVVASGATWEAPVGELFVIDRESGAVRWKFRTPTGYMITAGSTADGVVYAGTWDHTGLYAFPTTGDTAGVAPKPIWYAPISGQAYKNEAIAGDLLYVPTEAPNEILAVGKADGAIHWRLPQADVPNSTMVSGGMLFTSDKSGTIAAWAEPAIRDAIGQTVSGPLGVVAQGVLPPDPFAIIRTLGPATTGLETMLAMDVGPDGLIYALDAKPSVTVVDPATGGVVRTWGRQGTGDGEFHLVGLGNIAVGPNGMVTVTDSGNHRLQVFSADGTFIRQVGSFGAGAGQFSHPFRIASDDESSVYVLDDSGSLTKFDRDGTFVWRVPGSGTQSAAQLNDGTIVWLMDQGRVQRLDPATGAALDSWGGPGRGAGQLDASCVISVDSVGNEYIFGCDPVRTQVFDPDHRLLGGAYAPRDQVVVPIFGPNGEVYGHSPEFSNDDIYVLSDSLLPPPDPFTVTATLEPATTGLTTITDLAVGPDRLLYVLDVADRVNVIDPATGAAVRSWGKTGSGHGEFDFRTNDGNPGYGAIAVGADGLVYVGDGNNHRYQVFQPDGTFVRQVGSFGNGDGQFGRIFHIAADPQGNVYTVDMDLGRLSKFDAQGGFLWRIGGVGAAPPLNQILQTVVARPDGRLFQLVEVGGPVLELDPDTGATIDTWKTGPAGTLSFDSANNAYGYDYVPPEMRVFDPEHRLIGGRYGPTAHFTVIGPHDEAVSWHDATIDLMDVHLSVPGASP